MMKKNFRIAVLAGLIILFISGIWVSRSYKLPQFQGNTYYEEEWELGCEGTLDKTAVSLPTALEYQGPGRMSLSTVLTYQPGENDDPYALVSMNHMYFQVFLEDKLLYSYMPEDTDNISKSPGNPYALVHLPDDCAGKTFRIDFWMTLEDGFVYEVENVPFGDGMTVVYDSFWEDLPHNLITVCILELGLFMMALGIILAKNKDSSEMWNVGLFAVFLGIYTLSENQFNLIMLSNPYFGYLINFIVFASIPIPMLLFFKTKVTRQFGKWYNALLVVCGVNIFIQACLHFWRIKDIRQLVTMTHVVYAAMLLLIVISVARIPKDGYGGKKYILAGVLPIIIGGLADAALYYLDITDSYRNTYYSQMGVLIFLAVEGIYILKDFLHANEERIRSQYYKEMAYTDGLTRIRNRAAYMEKICQIDSNEIPFKGVTAVCADMNNLKQINDRFGHLSGDQVICRMADILRKNLEGIGSVYRIGGDEFAAFLDCTDESEILKRFDSIDKDVAKGNNDSELILEFAWGYAVLKEGETAESCIRRADEKMYEDKKRKKKLVGLPPSLC